MMKDVIIKETKEPATAIDTPAVTVCIEMVSLYLYKDLNKLPCNESYHQHYPLEYF